VERVIVDINLTSKHPSNISNYKLYKIGKF